MSSTPPFRTSTPPMSLQSLTHPRKSATATLIINNFSELSEGHKGTAICATGPSAKQSRFYFAIFPKNNFTWVSNDVLVCLYFYEEDIEVKYRVSVVNEKKNKVFTRSR